MQLKCFPIKATPARLLDHRTVSVEPQLFLWSEGSVLAIFHASSSPKRVYLLNQVQKEVLSSIAEQLPATIGVIFDGWRCDGEHYIAIFAT